jgi:predicted RNase H-like nuclease (RuvC/YqgF family)
MATEQAQTPRQREHEEARLGAERAAQERDAVGSRHVALNGELDEMRTQRAALESQRQAALEEAAGDPSKTAEAERLRDEITTLDRHIHSHTDLRDAAGRRATELSTAHSIAFSEHMRAATALRRESCETALQRIEELFGEIESAWAAAAAEAHQLSEQDQWWASAELTHLLGAFSPYVSPNRPWNIKLPRRSDPR